MEKTYLNPVHGKQGVFGGNYHKHLTRKEVIMFGAEHVVGSCNGIESDFDSFLSWLGQASGEKIDFTYDDLTLDELGIIDNIVFTCDGCGWNCEADDRHEVDGDCVCHHCYAERMEEIEDED